MSCAPLLPPTVSGLATLSNWLVGLASDPLLKLSVLRLPYSALVRLEPSSILLLPCLCGGGGGGGNIDDRLLGVEDMIGGEDISRLLILGGRPDIDLEDPRAGGIGGKDIVEGDVSGA